MQATKTCTKCDETKPLSEFYRHRDSHRPDCKICRRATSQRWRDANRDVYIETQRRYYNDHRDAYLAYFREYLQTHPDMFRERNAQRLALLAKVERSPYKRSEIYKRDGGRCCICRADLHNRSGAFHIDHIVPISLGGPDTPANVQLTCPGCNLRKRNRLEGQIHFGC